MMNSVMFCCLFFFFKQKTAYEMRISDWSSDVCSSDLGGGVRRRRWRLRRAIVVPAACDRPRTRRGARRWLEARSEERRVGKSVSVRVDLGGRRIIKNKNK